MRLGTAIECLVDNYKYASDKEWINDKVAWALYHTWKEADRTTESTGYNLSPVEDEPTTQTETQNSNLTFKTLEYCDICDHKGCEECIANALDEHCMPSQFKKQIEDECTKEYEELGLKELKELIEADRKTEPSNSEKPNNCEHITEDGVTCAKYPACDDCLDNPLNKVKGSERLVKGSDESQPEPSGYKAKPVEDEPQTERKCIDCKFLTYRFNKVWCDIKCDNPHDKVCDRYKPKDEPQKDCKKCKNYDRCKNNRWKCCVYQPKDEPQTDCAWGEYVND